MDADIERIAGNRTANKTVVDVNRLGLPRGTVPSRVSIVKRHERAGAKVLRTSTGSPLNTCAINCLMSRLAQRSGHKYALYDFRHGYATRMLQLGIDPVTVGVLMGHANPAMIASVYQHLAHAPKFLLEQATRVTV